MNLKHTPEFYTDGFVLIDGTIPSDDDWKVIKEFAEIAAKVSLTREDFYDIANWFVAYRDRNRVAITR